MHWSEEGVCQQVGANADKWRMKDLTAYSFTL